MHAQAVVAEEVVQASVHIRAAEEMVQASVQEMVQASVREMVQASVHIRAAAAAEEMVQASVDEMVQASVHEMVQAVRIQAANTDVNIVAGLQRLVEASELALARVPAMGLGLSTHGPCYHLCHRWPLEVQPYHSTS